MKRSLKFDYSILLFAIILFFALVASGAFSGAKPFGSEWDKIQVNDTVTTKIK